MRAPLLALSCLLAACGPVRLGEEIEDPDAQPVLDAGALQADREEIQVAVVVDVLNDCRSCVELSTTGVGGTPPYTVAWSDGSHAATRRLCSPSSDALSVTVSDAKGLHSAPYVTRVAVPDASCPPPPKPKLCLDNGSFEGTPAYNPTGTRTFDAPPWSDCTNPSRPNSPDIGNDTTVQQQIVANVPKPTDGKTYLGLMEDEQASAPLCGELLGGDTFSLSFDTRAIDITGGVVPNTEAAFLQIYGGVALDCSQRELLWASPRLAFDRWQHFCLTLTAQQYMNFLSLRSGSDQTQPTTIYLVVDNMVSVASCP